MKFSSLQAPGAREYRDNTHPLKPRRDNASAKEIEVFLQVSAMGCVVETGEEKKKRNSSLGQVEIRRGPGQFGPPTAGLRAGTTSTPHLQLALTTHNMPPSLPPGGQNFFRTRVAHESPIANVKLRGTPLPKTTTYRIVSIPPSHHDRNRLRAFHPLATV